jgi:hypothetical protein
MLKFTIYVLIAMTVIFVLFALVLMYDERKYPDCPECDNNLNSKRLRLSSGKAHCALHGDFLPGDRAAFFKRHVGKFGFRGDPPGRMKRPAKVIR